MSYGFTYNSVDLTNYGLVITSNELDLISQLIRTVNLPQRAYGWEAEREPRDINLKFSVVGTSLADLQTKLDSIKAVLVETTPHQLIFSLRSDRYYMAVLSHFDGKLASPTVFEGLLGFICTDQNAYKTSEDSNVHYITTDSITIVEAVGGTAPAYPVHKLTAGETLSSVTIKLKNENTGYEVEWTGSMVSTDYLEINCVTWTVKKNGVIDMASVAGEFPYLEGGVNNSLTVTGFGTTGTLLITYRDRYS